MRQIKCDNEERRLLVKDKIEVGDPINGINYLEIIDSTNTTTNKSQSLLLVHHLSNTGLDDIHQDNFIINGGVRRKNIKIHWVLRADKNLAGLDLSDDDKTAIGNIEAEEKKKVFLIRTEMGDFSEYALHVIVIVAFIAAALGDNQLSREIYLSANPDWLEPDQWPELVERHRSNACLVAWVLINTGDEKLGSALLRQAISYFDDSLPLLIEHSDMHAPDACYLMAGDIEKTLLSIETQLSHNHLYSWRAASLLPVYDLIRDEPRWLAAQAEYERRISVQRENIKKMAADQVPSEQTQP